MKICETGMASSLKPISTCGKPVSPGLTKPALVKPAFTQTGFDETGLVAIGFETGSVTDFRFGLRIPPIFTGIENGLGTPHPVAPRIPFPPLLHVKMEGGGYPILSPI